MTDLIQQLSEAVEGSRETDKRIKYLVTPALHDVGTVDEWLKTGAANSSLHYTTSLDAALTLVPDGALWAYGCMEEGPFCRLVVPNADGSYFGGAVEGLGHTVPLSACIAALKARETAA